MEESTQTSDIPITPRSGWAQTFASLHYPNFRLLWISTIFISGGNWIQQVTIGWLAYEMAEPEIAPLQVAIVLGLRAFPMLFSPVAGVIADRFDRRRAFMTNQAWLAALAIGFAAVLLLDITQMWHLYVFSFLAGAGWALNNPLRQTLVSNAVPRESLMNAIALHSMAFNSMRMVGPAAGGAFIALFGPGVNFLIQACLYVGVFVMLLPFRPIYAEARRVIAQSPFADLLEGLRYVKGHRITLLTILLSLAPTLFMMSFIMTQMPVYNGAVLGGGEVLLGWLMTAMGVGGFTGTLIMARFNRIRHKGRVILIGITGAGIGMLGLSQTDVLWQVIPLLMFQQVFFMTVMMTNNTVLQTITPDSMRGRVMGVYMMDIGMQPLGGLIAGLIATAYSVSVAWVFGATVGLLVMVLVAIFAPSFRRLEL
ncbi:MAG: MFS transporter [Dehalococcoidia bacterium]